jgi:hypothetical protein
VYVNKIIGSEILTAVTMMISVLRDAILCRSERAELSLLPISDGFLLGLCFYPEIGRDTRVYQKVSGLAL